MKPNKLQFGDLGKMGKALGHAPNASAGRGHVDTLRAELTAEPAEHTNEEFIAEMGGPEALIEHRRSAK